MRSLAAVLALTLLACGADAPPRATAPRSTEGGQGHTAPTEFTRRAQAEVAASLPLDDRADFEDAERGLVARDPNLVVHDAAGAVIWDMPAYDFETGPAPDSVNPSLWRQAQLNNRHGLFEVADGIHQVRGYDLSNMTLIRGETGLIVVDPLTARENAVAALAIAREHLGELPVVAVIYTHSHIDHFGGAGAVVSAEDAASGRVRVIAPAHFVAEATSENVLAGIAMGRRATYMFGNTLERSARAHVGSGLGKAPALGRFELIPPNEIVDRTPQETTIDGVRFVFQYTPESEAPAELTFYLPDRKALCGAEVVNQTLHNLYTLRGAKVRDALKWSGYIHEMLSLFDGAEVLFMSHHWPVWGREGVRDHLAKQRDTYKFIHDQTLRLANAGFTGQEIAEQLVLPESLRTTFGSRGYYGSVRHNAKAVYQGYFGWYDGNPAKLDPLPPEAAGKRYVEFMGGRDAVLEKATASYEQGQYRWAAMVLDHLVFAEPGDGEAKELLARCYDQLGYQAESGPWRDVYLTGALELRQGPGGTALDVRTAGGLLRHMPVARFFDSMAARIDGAKAEGTQLMLNFVFTDLDESYVLTLENAVLSHRRADPHPEADVTLRVTRELWIELATGNAGLRELLFSDELDIEGSRRKLLAFFQLLENPAGIFPIVTP
jgi:alkyl sulfatase BDS1-like metallo-beta-lactamase superfamily hydrolase